MINEDLIDGAEAKSRWDDPDFVAEMTRREKEVDEGKDVGRSWEDVHNAVRQHLNRLF